MSVASEYFKSAAASLRRAALAVQDEINRLRHDVDNITRSKQSEVNHLRQEINKRETALTMPDPKQHPDKSIAKDRSELAREVTAHQKQLIDEEHEINRIRDQIHQVINQKQHEVDDIQRKASELEAKS